MSKTNLAILVGGKSSRFGTDKCTYNLNGKMMIEWITGTIGHLFDEVLFVGMNSKLNNCIPDLNPGLGPISGLETALSNSDKDVFLVSCDMPFVKADIVKLILKASENHLIICPIVNEAYQVTHAFYSKKILPDVRNEMLKANPSLRHLVSICEDSIFIPESQFKCVEDYKMSFLNFNFFEDLKQRS